MLNRKSVIRKKKPWSRKKRDLYFLIILTSIILSMIFYYNYKQDTINVPDNIPKIYITCQHRIRRFNYRDCVIDVAQDSTIAEIKIRGVFNSFHEKKGYRLRLYEQKSYLGMRRDDDWQLFAMYLDHPHMRVKLSLDLWRSLESTNPTAILPNSRYVNLYLNGKYHGLYLLAEKPDKKLFDLDSDQRNLDSSLIFQLKSISDFREYDEDVWEQDLPIPNDNHDKEIMNGILGNLISFVNNTSNEEFFDSNHGIYSKFDKQNLIDFYVYNYFILHLDFWYKNYFIIRNTNPSKFFLIPWDFDGSFGQWGEIKYSANINTEITIREQNELFNRLLDNENFRQDCKKRWFELREESWTENYIMDMLFEIYGEIKESMEISMALYDMDDKMDEYVNYLIQWIPDRIDFCDSYFTDL